MIRALLSGFALSLLFPSWLLATSVTFHLEIQPDTAKLATDGQPPSSLILTKDEPQLKTKTIVLGESLTGKVTKIAELDPGKWRIILDAENLWMLPRAFEVTTEHLEIEAPLWAAGQVRGTFELSEKVASSASLPQNVEVRFNPSPSATREPAALPEGLADCQVVGREWRCKLPVGLHDLRFFAQGFISHYFWDIPIAKDRSTKLATVKLDAGAAILGWITTEDRSHDLDGIALKLQPRSSKPPVKKEDRQRLDALTQEALSDQRGFFQFRDIAAGDYWLVAHKEPFAVARTSIRVQADQVVEVHGDPLILRLPKRLALVIDPPVPPGDRGERWIAKLVQVDRGGSPLRWLDALAVEVDGTTTFADLAWGTYRLRVETPDGQEWLMQKLLFDESTATLLSLSLPLIEIRGSLRFGDEPLQASVFFGGSRDSGIEMVSDEQGRFTGLLPRDGIWRAEIVAAKLKMRRTLQQLSVERKAYAGHAEIAIELPKTFIRGVVVDREGRPVERAMVTVQGHDRSFDSLTQQGTDEEGAFELAGLPQGVVTVRASKSYGPKRFFSQEEVLDVDEDSEPDDVRLILAEEIKLRARVVAGGRGVPGAVVKAHSTSAIGMPVSRRSTDPDGHFEVSFPPPAHEVLIGVAAPGFAYKMLRLAIPEEGQTVEIPLTQAAGQLVIELDQDRERWPAPILAILHNRVLESADYLRQSWARLHGVEDDPRQIRLPEMEPGQYSICWTDAEQLAVLAMTGQPTSACASGHLAPSAELVLAKPSQL